MGRGGAPETLASLTDFPGQPSLSFLSCISCPDCVTLDISRFYVCAWTTGNKGYETRIGLLSGSAAQ